MVSIDRARVAKGRPITRLDSPSVTERTNANGHSRSGGFRALCSGALGLKWISDSSKVNEAMKAVESLGLGDNPEIKAAVAKARFLVIAAYLLVLGAVVAVVTTVVWMKRPEMTKIYGGVLIACALVPALFAAKSLVFTFFLVVAGGLCLAGKSSVPAVRPQPVGAGA